MFYTIGLTKSKSIHFCSCIIFFGSIIFSVTINEINRQYKAIIFDLDGVITHTAKLHFNAWKQLFDAFLEAYAGQQSPFTQDDYDQYVDGKPRYEGVESFLKSRQIALPLGTEEDSPGDQSIYGLGKKKNALFQLQLEERGVETYDDTLACIRHWKSVNMKMAVVSSSKNCRLVLEKASLIDMFDAIFDGQDAKEQQVKGKPAPDIFLKAADQMQVNPGQTVVFEDAIAGVTAGKRGNFGLVIGVDRAKQREGMTKAGADLVINSLNELNPS